MQTIDKVPRKGYPETYKPVINGGDVRECSKDFRDLCTGASCHARWGDQWIGLHERYLWFSLQSARRSSRTVAAS